MKVYSDSKISINTREEFEEVTLRILNDVCKALDKNPLDESLMADLHWLRREQDHICAWIEAAKMMDEKRKNK